MSTVDHKRVSGQKRGWQFSLGTLLIVMAWVSVTCVALRSPNELWSGIVFIFAMGSLLSAALLIVFRGGRTRAFAVGFIIFGAAYLFISDGDTYEEVNARPRLPTTRWAIAIYTLVHGENRLTSTTMTPIYSSPVPASYLAPPPVGTTIERVTMTTPISAGTTTITEVPVPSPATSTAGTPVNAPPTVAFVARSVTQPTVSLASFLEVAHQSLAILLGIVGGIAAQLLYTTQREDAGQRA